MSQTFVLIIQEVDHGLTWQYRFNAMSESMAVQYALRFISTNQAALHGGPSILMFTGVPGNTSVVKQIAKFNRCVQTIKWEMEDEPGR